MALKGLPFFLAAGGRRAQKIWTKFQASPREALLRKGQNYYAIAFGLWTQGVGLGFSKKNNPIFFPYDILWVEGSTSKPCPTVAGTL